ncbi:MAG: citryl-CoA lyase [Steroidobacteraceae bacterium]
MTTEPRSDLCRYTTDAVYYRGNNLVRDLIGKASFVDVFFRQAFGRDLGERERRIVDAVLVTMMEHGLTPSAIAARMVYSSSPENIQAAVAAGILAVGSRFVGAMEEAAVLLQRIVEADDPLAEAKRVAKDHRERKEVVPGFGHHLHKPDDPRATALLELARETSTADRFAQALRLLAAEVDAAAKRHITINATGAVAAILGDIGVPPRLMRGFAVLSRTAGLLAHIAEEQSDPAYRLIWDLGSDHYQAPKDIR